MLAKNFKDRGAIMPKASQFTKPKNDKSSLPSGHVAKPPKGAKQPLHLTDDNRVVYSEEVNLQDG